MIVTTYVLMPEYFTVNHVVYCRQRSRQSIQHSTYVLLYTSSYAINTKPTEGTVKSTCVIQNQGRHEEERCLMKAALMKNEKQSAFPREALSGSHGRHVRHGDPICQGDENDI